MTLAQTRLDELWDFSDPSASEARLRLAAEQETDAATRAELQTQVARSLGLQERFAEADAVLDAVTIDDAAVAARAALERGRVRNSSGDREAALPYFLAAADAASGSGLTFLEVDALHMLAIADPDQAEEWTAAAFAALEGDPDARTLRWNVSLHNNAGWRHFDAGRLDEALTSFEAARDAATRWGTPQQVQWADEALAEAREAREAREGRDAAGKE
jgi:tetratricopeptide (TPR) repeat protein